MATKTGTVSQNKSKYKFYISYSTSFSTSTMKWTVTAKVYLQVSYYAYEGRTTHKLSIGGTVKSSKSNYTKACYSNSGTKSFLIASGTQTYAASASSRSVTISASMSASAAGYGPGTCSASVTVTLGAKLSSAGKWGIATSTINSLTYSVTGLSTSLGYTRKVYFDVGPYGGSYTKTQSKSVGASTSSVSFTTTGLMPGTRYQIRARVYAPNNALMLTLTGNIYTKSETMTLSASSVTAEEAKLSFKLATKNIGYERKVYWYKRLKGASSWTSVSGTTTVANGSNTGSNTFKNLVDDSDVNDNSNTDVSVDGNVLVVYFSAQGHTEEVAGKIAQNLGGDVFSIEPSNPYTSDDLDWTDSNSRISREHEDESLRDMELEVSTPDNWESYDTVLIGYPIWWGIAAWPTNAFVQANDFTGKTVIPFCTSSSSGLGESGSLLEEAANGGTWQDGYRFSSNPSDDEIREWTDSLSL